MGRSTLWSLEAKTSTESTVALHGPGYSGGDSLYSAYNSGTSLAAGFNVYAVEWSPTTIKWFVNGVQVMERTPQSLPSGDCLGV